MLKKTINGQIGDKSRGIAQEFENSIFLWNPEISSQVFISMYR